MKKVHAILPFALVLLSAVLSAGSASAQILFDNGPAVLGNTGGGYGYYADSGNTQTESGNVFTPTLSGTAYLVSFAGIYYGGSVPTTDTFVLSLYSTVSGAPDVLSTPVTSTLSDVSRTVRGTGITQTIYEFTGILNSPLTLDTGTYYYLGISDTTNPYKDFAVAVAAPTGATSEFSYETTTSSFEPGTDALSFQLSAPEPSNVTLLVLGAAGLLLAAQRTRRLNS
jgi:hypothetical protein